MTESAVLRPSPRVRRIQLSAVTLLLVSGMVNFIDRGTLSVANPLIRHDLHLSISQMGLLLSSFLWAYSFTQLPVGGLVDRFRPRIVLTAGLVLWSFAQAIGGLVTGFWPFIGARVLLGIGEAPQFMTCVRVVRDWFSISDRGLPNGFLGGASSLGLAVAPPLLTVIMLSYGWRTMFVIMGGVGVVLAVIWYLTYREADAIELTASEHAYLNAGEAVEPSRPVTLRNWLALFQFGTTWGIVLGFIGTVYLSSIYMTWLPGYLEIDRHVSVFKTGFLAAIPFLFGVIGSMCGGYLIDVLVARNVRPLLAAKIPVAGGLLGASLLSIFVPMVPSPELAITLISGAVFFGYISTGAAWTLVSTVAPKDYVGSLAGMKNFGGYFGGALAPTITGFLVDATHSFQLSIVLGAGIGVVGAAIYWFVVRAPISESELLGRVGTLQPTAV